MHEEALLLDEDPGEMNVTMMVEEAPEAQALDATGLLAVRETIQNMMGTTGGQDMTSMTMRTMRMGTPWVMAMMEDLLEVHGALEALIEIIRVIGITMEGKTYPWWVGSWEGSW